MRAVSVESYKHKFAKAVLADWLRNAEEQRHDDYADVFGLRWRSNRADGVFEEYPIVKSMVRDGFVWAWDEECIPNTKCPCIPTFEQLCSLKDPDFAPVAILDVAVLHKGLIIYGFEVVHKNDVSPLKAEILNSIYFQVFSISADWILSQVNRPEKLLITDIFGKEVA